MRLSPPQTRRLVCTVSRWSHRVRPSNGQIEGKWSLHMLDEVLFQRGYRGSRASRAMADDAEFSAAAFIDEGLLVSDVIISSTVAGF